MPSENQLFRIQKVDWRFVFKNSFYYLLLIYLLLAGSRGELIARELAIFWIDLVLLFIFFLIWFQKMSKPRVELIDSRPIYIFMAFIVFGFVSTLLNDSLWKSITDLFVWGAALFAMLFFQFLRGSWKQIELLDPILVIGSVFHTGKIAVFLHWMIDWARYLPGQYQYLFKYRGVSPNISSAFANVIFIIALTQIFADNESRTKWIYYYTSASALAVIMISGSRGGLIGCVVGLSAVFLIRYFVRFGEKQKKQKIILTAMILLMGLLGLGVIFYFSMKSGRVGLADRFEFWVVAVQNWINNPWFGSGINTIGSEILSIRSVPPVQLHTHAHNLFLNLLSEVGLLGFSIFLGFTGYLVYQYLQEYINHSSPMALGSLGMIAVIFAHGLVDTLYIEPFILFTCLLIFGITAPKGGKIDPIGKGAVNLFFCGILGVGLFLGIHKNLYGRALNSFESGDFEKGAEQMSNILLYANKNALVQQQSGIFFSYLADQESDPILRNDYLIASIQGFDKAASLEPNFGGHHANLGIMYWEYGRPEKALDHLAISTVLAPESVMFVLNSGVVAEEVGKLSAAKEYYGWLLDKRAWIDSSFWKETQFRQRIFYNYQKQQWIEQVSANDSPGETENQSQGLNIRDKIRYIEELIDNNEIESAYFTWNQLRMQLGKTKSLAVEMKWLEADLAAAQGELTKAVLIGSEAVENWQAQSSVGAGGIGYTDYGMRFFRSSAYKEDLVPFGKTFPITETWESRLVELEDWKDKTQNE